MQSGGVSRIFTHVIMADIKKLIGVVGRGIGPMPNFAYYEWKRGLSRLRIFGHPDCASFVTS
jgi:hypothetical protein